MLLFCTYSLTCFGQIDFLSPMLKHVRGGVIWLSYLRQTDNIPQSFQVRGYGVALLITIKDDPESWKLFKANGFTESDNHVRHQFNFSGEIMDTTDKSNCPHCEEKDPCKRNFSDRFTINVGYEYTPYYQKIIDQNISNIPLKGFYVGGFYTLLSFANKTTPLCKRGSLYFGLTTGIFSISEATANISDSTGLMPIKYSSETVLAPELSLGINYNVFKIPFFVDIGYQYMNFESISYTSVLDGTGISPDKYVSLPNAFSFSSIRIRAGIIFSSNGLFK